MVEVVIKIPAIEKLLDYLASGIGATAGPLLLPLRAKMEGKADRISARAYADALPIIAQAQADARQYLVEQDAEDHGTVEITHEHLKQQIEFQGLKRLANIRSVVEGAAEELGDKEVPDHEPDHDWTARFFDCVQDVSSKDMQRLWSKLLSGEVESPGRTSLHTLSILRDMSQSEAEVFSNLMKYRISDFLLEKCLEEIGGREVEAQTLKLVHIGLAYSSMVAYTSISLSPNGIYDTEHNGCVLRIEGPPGTRIDFNGMISPDLTVMLLTPPSKELARFCIHEPCVEYLSCFARVLNGQKCSLKLAPISGTTPDGRICFDPSTMRTL